MSRRTIERVQGGADVAFSRRDVARIVDQLTRCLAEETGERVVIRVQVSEDWRGGRSVAIGSVLSAMSATGAVVVDRWEELSTADEIMAVAHDAATDTFYLPTVQDTYAGQTLQATLAAANDGGES